MTSTKPADPANLVDQATQSADQMIKSTQRATNSAFDGLVEGVQELRGSAAPMLDQASERAASLAQRSLDAIRNGSQQLRDTARNTRAGTVHYVRHEPVKAMLIAAATGAALMALVTLASRSRSSD
jgi:ElaB/YqjD/DUF883 family membrane-anchored ribosome-binding protein